MTNYLVVGAGLYGAVFARELALKGHKVHIIEKADHIAGHIFTEEIAGIQVHKFGAHIFHTNDKEIWEYINQFTDFNHYVNSPIANYKGQLYNLPFNMNTFNKLWGVVTPEEAKAKIESQKAELKHEPRNLEEQAISLVGRDVYEKLIKGYTEKQWGKSATELPAFIIRRLPLRFTFDNNYFNDPYQGIPIGGYTQIVEKMLDHENISIELNKDFFSNKEFYLKKYDKIIYTGMIDQFFDYQLGRLEYRSLHFETEVLDMENYQGNAVVNYTDRDTPYTRIIEHKHFEFGTQPQTVVTKEYPKDWSPEDEPYYPINDDRNNHLYRKYVELTAEYSNIIFGGRLGMYRYFNMDQVMKEALNRVSKEI